MAGSWQHMTTEDGRLLSNERFHGMLDTGGDVYEAAEECFGMIWWLASQLASRRAEQQQAGQASRGQVLEIIRQAEEHHQVGLRLGRVQDSY